MIELLSGFLWDVVTVIWMLVFFGVLGAIPLAFIYFILGVMR